MIQFQHVTKAYENGSIALDCVSFELGAGEMAFLTGHSGAGKTTLFKLIASIERPTSGQIYVDGLSLTRLSTRSIPFLRRRIGLIFQDPQLLRHRTVFDNVALPLVISGFKASEIKRRVHAALDKVGLLDKEKCLPSTLSSGEHQRIGIARAVVHRPHILLADEPTGNLDPDLALDIMRLFEAFYRVGVTVLIATHDLSLVARLKHRNLILRNGQLTGGLLGGLLDG
ncbi:MAG: cell division ATP-binding protein FtsE [Gammaproteobacteria bacterium RIFCSPHIGHO2_12_FULL_45_9]|nr:MAG: cell division ATP-binding protein FtsE [Gammaproteobacteria bacterium RIFCSPHIGHO2_12_FULL_45_9]